MSHNTQTIAFACVQGDVFQGVDLHHGVHGLPKHPLDEEFFERNAAQLPHLEGQAEFLQFDSCHVLRSL